MQPTQTRLLEREEPRSRLEQALAAALAGHGHIVSLEGEAGIGKTALAMSFTDAHRRDARIYVGGCEHLATPEPLGPLHDVARDSEGRFNFCATGPLTTFEALLRLLKSGRTPGVLLIEDIHWADDVTLDLLRYLGRRIRVAPVLIVVTFRNDEAPSQARLAALWSDIPRDCRERIELRPLSPAAVALLAGQPAPRAAREIFDVTGGNPFHVTEFLATEDGTVPRSLRESTLARATRLSVLARRTLDCASIFPRQIDQEMLRSLSQDAEFAGVEECIRAGMLNAAGGGLAFRHELARRAVHDSMAPLRRQDLHRGALELLKGRPHVRAAEIAHHAHEAQMMHDLFTYSLRAADEAESLGAFRESVQHLTRALTHGTWLSAIERADLLERQAETGEQCGAFEVAVAAIEEAISARRHAGDILGLGNSSRISARLQWHHGRAEVAEEQVQQALDVMREHRETWQYAMALSTQSQLDMLADRNTEAIPRGLEAMARAKRLGRWDIYLHALTNATTAQCSADVEAGVPQMLAAIAETQRRSGRDFLPRLYANLVYMMTGDRQYENLFEYFDQGIAAAAARDNAPLEAYIRGTRALALIDLGRVAEAVSEAELVIYGPYPRATSRFNAKIALARARIRTGMSEDGVLDELRTMPTSQRDIMRRSPLAVVDAEALWLGLPRPGALERLRAAFEAALRAQGQRWTLADTAIWLKILGEPLEIPPACLSRLRPAPRAFITGDWREAARLWGELGCPYEQAIALSMGDPAAQLEGLSLFDRCGAAPAASRLRRHMRAGGTRAVPRGPTAHTRTHPAGLTRRQVQVLALIDAGLSTERIAERLYISTKTTQHHVSAILAQLGASSRHEAAAAARERGLLSAHEN
jgi:DNA-binding CsgD family transcriptional regulator